jgi:hypothetical protein
MDNCIFVHIIRFRLFRKKNYPSIIVTANDNNSDVKDLEKREILISPNNSENLANSYLLYHNSKTSIQKNIFGLSVAANNIVGERNLAMTVHVDKFPLASKAIYGDPISIGAYQLLKTTVWYWYHNIIGESVQQHQLAHEALSYK